MKQIAFRLKPGQLLKEEIEKIAVDHNIEAGVLLSVVAGLNKVILRMSGATPAKQDIRTWTGHYEVVSGTGTISKAGCHIHISVSDSEGHVFGGHLKDGCTIYPTAEVVIGIIEDAKFLRVMDEKTGFGELVVE